MGKYLRLRQICLVAAELEPAVADIGAILGIAPCYHDPNVAPYGLVNAVFPIGHSFLEVVAPVAEATTAGRFLERSGGRGGYMVIIDCDDPERRQSHAAELGIRIAHVSDYGGYLGVQLHPRDCRAAMIELNRTVGGEDIAGPYHPAGPDWPAPVPPGQARAEARALLEAELESPDPAGLAAHWGRILERPVTSDGAGPVIVLDAGVLRFLPAPAGMAECLAGLRIAVADPQQVLAAASARGHAVTGGGFHCYGVRISPLAAV
jgi:hypothetical protein